MIRVYSIKNCPYCDELKELLTKENIPFMDIDINLPENIKEFDKINEIAKTDSVPVVFLKKQILVPEISFKTIKQAILVIKNILNT